MPYLNDDELALLNNKIDIAEKELSKAKVELKETSKELENVEEKLENYDDDIKGIKKNKTIQNVILSILLGIALALAYYFYNKKSNKIDVNEIKRLEAVRVLDSINTLNAEYLNNNNSNSSDSENAVESVDDTLESIKNNINDEKIYSVQVGAFAESNYTLLSETLAGISSQGDLFKYSIGLFKTLQEAQDFRKELVRVGFSDAFVASYINGVRQEIENPN